MIIVKHFDIYDVEQEICKPGSELYSLCMDAFVAHIPQMPIIINIGDTGYSVSVSIDNSSKYISGNNGDVCIKAIITGVNVAYSGELWLTYDCHVWEYSARLICFRSMEYINKSIDCDSLNPTSEFNLRSRQETLADRQEDKYNEGFKQAYRLVNFPSK